MIVTKQRKSFQSVHHTDKYISLSPNEQNFPRNYRPSGQTVPFNYNNRQRHSISHTASIQKNNPNTKNYERKSQKKYDYSVNFQRSVEKQQMNKTHDKIHISQQPNVTFLLDGYEKRRYSSTKEHTPKYNYSPSRQMHNGEFSDVLKSCNKLSGNHQKIDVKQYLKAYEPRHQSTQKMINKNPLHSQNNKENKPANTKAFFTQNKLEDNFTATDKFIEFKTQKKAGENQVKRYEPQYSRMRNHNTKKYSMIVDEGQEKNIAVQKKLDEGNIEGIDLKGKLNFESLLKNSSVENGKIYDKLSRISMLNEQINVRLNKMLHNRHQVA